MALTINNSKEIKNTIEIEGYLKENTLAVRQTKDGREAIYGTLVVALNEKEEYRINCIACRLSKTGKELFLYKKLEAVLPAYTTSMATALQSGVSISFEGAAAQATRICVTAKFETNDRRDEAGHLISSIRLNCTNAYIKTDKSRTLFTPRAYFDVEGYVDALRPELDSDKEETGNILVDLSIPDYFRETVTPVTFICKSESARKCIDNYYQKGSCGRFVGHLKSVREETLVKGEAVEYLDGTVEQKTRTTATFINERVIEKMVAPYEEESNKYISAEEIRFFKANRETMLQNLPTAKPASTIGNGGDFLNDNTTPNVSRPHITKENFKI